MATAPILKLKLVDAFGEQLQQPTVVMCRNQINGQVATFQVPAGKTAALNGLSGAPKGLYSVQVDPASYLPCGVFVNLPASGSIGKVLAFAVDPDRIAKVEFPAFTKLAGAARQLLDKSKAVTGFAGKAGTALYNALDDIRRAGFLNIVSKTTATSLNNGRTVASYFESLEDLRGDRFFCVVAPELADEVKNAAAAGLFMPVDGSLHEPPPGMVPAGSFKTLDHYGNLQLTFFSDAERWLVDVDIDDAAGLAHVFQVLPKHAHGPAHASVRHPANPDGASGHRRRVSIRNLMLEGLATDITDDLGHR